MKSFPGLLIFSVTGCPRVERQEVGHHSTLAPPRQSHRVRIASKLSNGLLHPVQRQAQVSQTQVTRQILGLVREESQQTSPAWEIRTVIISELTLTCTPLWPPPAPLSWVWLLPSYPHPLFRVIKLWTMMASKEIIYRDWPWKSWPVMNTMTGLRGRLTLDCLLPA